MDDPSQWKVFISGIAKAEMCDVICGFFPFFEMFLIMYFFVWRSIGLLRCFSRKTRLQNADVWREFTVRYGGNNSLLFFVQIFDHRSFQLLWLKKNCNIGEIRLKSSKDPNLRFVRIVKSQFSRQNIFFFLQQKKEIGGEEMIEIELRRERGYFFFYYRVYLRFGQNFGKSGI